jgi:preprotein translocase SecE subunit
VARETRRQRRDARRTAGDQGGGGVPRPQRRPAAEAGPADGDGSEWGASGSGALTAPSLAGRVKRRSWFSFLRESWAELRKVEWPNRSQVVQGTVVVLIACTIVGVFLYGADQAIRPLVKHVFLGQ